MPRGDARQYFNLQYNRKKEFPMIHTTVMLRPDQLLDLEELHHKDGITISEAHRLALDVGLAKLKEADR